MTRYRYEMDVTVLVDTTRGYYPEQPITVGGEFDADDNLDRDAVQERLLDEALDRFVRESPNYTRNRFLYQMDDRRWSLVTGGKVTRFELTAAGAEAHP